MEKQSFLALMIEHSNFGNKKFPQNKVLE